jgi:hypothetical protein
MICLLNTGALYAHVYRCTGQTGIRSYQDHPCTDQAIQKAILPIPTTPTDLKIVDKEHKMLLKQDKKLAMAQRKRIRSETHKRLQAEKIDAKNQKRIQQCVHLQEKITQTETQLRQGKRIKRFITLETELEQHRARYTEKCSL